MKKLIVFIALLIGSTAKAEEPAAHHEARAAEKEVVTHWDISNQCETFTIRYSKTKKRYYKRNRVKWSKEDRRRTFRLATMVAREMGADPRLLKIQMNRASGGNPHAIHILNEDLKAHEGAYQKFYWSKSREEALIKIVETGNAKTKVFWESKVSLKRIQTYKHNPYYGKQVEFDVIFENGNTTKGKRPVFMYGYGPLDMNAVYFTRQWDNNAPPWIFCAYGGIPAMVVAIWQQRSYQQECESLGFPGSYGIIDRRYARGHCREPSESFKKRAAKFGLDPDERAQLGHRWRKHNTDRKEILEFMINKATKRRLLLLKEEDPVLPPTVPVEKKTRMRTINPWPPMPVQP